MNKGKEPDIKELIAESIALEANIAKLYLFFSKSLPSHSNFWKKFHQEEKSHASLIKSGEKVLLEKGLFPSEVLSRNIHSLRTMNGIVLRVIDFCRKSRPSMEYALSYAILIEESAGEKNFQNAFKSKPKSFGFELFSMMNRNFIDHALRMRSYAKQKRIKLYHAIIRSVDLPI
ncbi:MAG: hypothetical protein HY809_06570 [Nitrospirae bacterium]|nr:hypothetical protein [Nitrospirota bacterium]